MTVGDWVRSIQEEDWYDCSEGRSGWCVQQENWVCLFRWVTR